MEQSPDFIELAGASGKRYRFKRVPDLTLLPVAGGNFVYVKHVDGQLNVVACGASETLHKARDLWSRAVDEHGVDTIYVRLNISRTQRLAEHEDLAEAQPEASQMAL